MSLLGGVLEVPVELDRPNSPCDEWAWAEEGRVGRGLAIVAALPKRFAVRGTQNETAAGGAGVRPAGWPHSALGL